jgi:hypothetical protein
MTRRIAAALLGRVGGVAGRRHPVAAGRGGVQIATSDRQRTENRPCLGNQHKTGITSPDLVMAT